MVYLNLHFEANQTGNPKCHPSLAKKWRMTGSGRRLVGKAGGISVETSAVELASVL